MRVGPLGAVEQALTGRGPDSRGEWTSDDGKAELLFRRLSIVDHTDKASQPFVRADLGLVAVLNGEIYNYSELRRTLSGYDIRSQSDTEVLLLMYHSRGVHGFKALRGMFACAILDTRRQRLVLCRDPIGKKPLFLHIGNQEILFGSSVLPIRALCASELRQDDQAVNDFWRTGFIHPTRTVFQGIRPILPGEVLEFDWFGRLYAQQSCKPETSALKVSSFNEAVEAIRALLDQAVRRRLHNNPVPVTLLSGGIDSTVVTSAVANVGQAKAITLSGHRWMVPDYPYACYAARRLGLPLVRVRLLLGELAEEVVWVTSLQDEPFGPISFFPLALMMREARKHTKIVLTGDGGDEVFLGYGKAADWFRKTPGRRSPCDQSLVGPGTPAWMTEWGKEWIGPTLLGHMFCKLDRASAEQGIEARCPLLDWDLMAAARSLPPAILLRAGRTKAVLKGLLADWPAQFLERKKVGFTFRVRWLWGASLFRGVAELVDKQVVERFAAYLPAGLRKQPRSWRAWDIFRNFNSVWKLIVWSQFERKTARLLQSARKSSASYSRSAPAK